MDILFILIPISLLLLCGAVAVFLWAVNNKQFEDLEKHGHDIIFDDDQSQTLASLVHVANRKPQSVTDQADKAANSNKAQLKDHD